MKIDISFLAALAFVFLSCSNDIDNNVPDPGNTYPPNSFNCIEGAGSIVTESRTVADPFKRIENILHANLFLSQGTFEDIVIEGQQNLIDAVRTTVVNGTLVLDQSECVANSEPINIYITLPEMESLKQSGWGDMVFENDFVLTDLQIDLEEVGDITLRGAVEVLDIELGPGLGFIHAFDMVSDLCEVRLEGVGDVEVFVNEELEVILSGTGNVYYKGNPTLITDITGTGAVIDAN